MARPEALNLPVETGNRREGSVLHISVVVAAIMLIAGPAVSSPPDTLSKIKETGKLVIGFREDAPPFAFRDADGKPAGYSVELCQLIAERVTQVAERADLDVAYVAVPADKRLAMVESGEIDIECGASTDTLERRERVDFTLHTFVTGAEMLLKAGSAIDDLRDLKGKTVGVLQGTTTEAGLRAALAAQALTTEVVTFDRHEQGLEALETDQIAAYFADRILLLGMVAKAMDASKLKLSGRFYSYEPYAFMIRRGDSGFRLVADTVLADTYRSGRIWPIYERWFHGARPSELLVALFVLQSLPTR